MVSIDEFIIVSSNYVPGYEIIRIRGFSYGLTVEKSRCWRYIGAGISMYVWRGNKRIFTDDGSF